MTSINTSNAGLTLNIIVSCAGWNVKFLETHPRFRRQVQAAIGISPVESMNGYANGHYVEGSIESVGTDIVHTVVHIKLIDYTEEGRALLIHAMREAEKYRVGEQNT